MYLVMLTVSKTGGSAVDISAIVHFLNLAILAIRMCRKTVVN